MQTPTRSYTHCKCADFLYSIDYTLWCTASEQRFSISEQQRQRTPRAFTRNPLIHAPKPQRAFSQYYSIYIYIWYGGWGEERKKETAAAAAAADKARRSYRAEREGENVYISIYIYIILPEQRCAEVYSRVVGIAQERQVSSSSSR